MIDCGIDIAEIKDILLALYPKESDDVNDAENTLEQLTELTDDEFLNSRACAIRTVGNNDSTFYNRLKFISKTYCKTLDCISCPLSKYCNANILRLQKSYNHNAPVMVDLFCGAGGLSLGFTQQGYVTSLANDIEPCCIDTYAHNHPKVPRKHIILGDIKGVVDKMVELLRFKDVDVVVGGPPCQGFSMANRQRLIDDPRNHLYKEYVRAVKTIQPKFFVMENVKGMLSVAQQVVSDFKAIGYDVAYRVVNAKDFGVPQNRERLIYIGNRIEVDNENVFEALNEIANKSPSYVLDDALYGLRPLVASRSRNTTETSNFENGARIEANHAQEDNNYIKWINSGVHCSLTFNHKARFNNDRDIEIYGRLNPGDKSDDPKIADIMPYARRNGIFKDKYFKLKGDKVCKTITAHMKYDCNMYIHPYQARGLTPREAARVQSYPDDYYFRGAYTKTYMQIGNSVPPLLGNAIAAVIKKYLGGKEL